MTGLSCVQRWCPKPIPRLCAFCLNELSDRFISFESLATGVRALECALSSLTSSFVYSLRLLFVFFAT